MQKKTLLLLGAGAVALYLLTRKKVAPPKGTKGWLGQTPWEAWSLPTQAGQAAATAAGTPAVTCPAGTTWNGQTCVYTGAVPYYPQTPYYGYEGGYQVPYGYGAGYGYQQPYYGGGYNPALNYPATTEAMWAMGQGYNMAPPPEVSNV